MCEQELWFKGTVSSSNTQGRDVERDIMLTSGEKKAELKRRGRRIVPVPALYTWTAAATGAALTIAVEAWADAIKASSKHYT